MRLRSFRRGRYNVESTQTQIVKFDSIVKEKENDISYIGIDTNTIISSTCHELGLRFTINSKEKVV